jgi:integrase
MTMPKDERRAPGESTIHKGTDGRWHGYVSMGTKAGGKRDRRHVSASTRAAVVAKIRELQERRDAGVTATSGTMTVAAWLDHWLDNIAVNRVRARTLESYRQLVRLHIKPAIGHHRLARLQPEHVEAMHAEMRTKGLASASVLRAHRVLSRALKVAEQRGRVARNVARLVDAPSAGEPASGEALSPVEARAVLAVASTIRNGARWIVALALGLRQSEVLGLRWSDVDLDAGTLRVRKTLHRIAGGGLVYEDPKSARSRRTLVLPRPLVDALRAHRAAQAAERLQAGITWEDHGLVFAQPNGRPIDKKADWRAWHTLLRSAKVRRVRLHDARHTAATTLLILGVDVRVVAELLGHADTRTTREIYQHVMPALAEDAATRMTTALWAPGSDS